MRNHDQSFWSIAIPIVLIALVAGSLSAVAAERVVIRVPFDFVVGSTPFPPGEYALTFGVLLRDAMAIECQDLARKAIVMTRRDPMTRTAAAGGLVRFNVYGERRFLSSVRTGAGGNREIAQSAVEAEIAKAWPTPTVADLRVEREKRP